MRLRYLLAFSMIVASAACGDDDGMTTPMMDSGPPMTDGGGDTDSGGGDLDSGMPAAAAAYARSGTIVAEEGSPGASGFVSIEIADDGTVSIELADDFEQGSGPGDTELRLAMADTNLQEQLDADPDSVTESLAIIPNGMTGAMSVDVPAGVDVNAFDYVVVWCPTAAINFGAAALEGRTGQLVPEAGSPMASGGVSVWTDADGASHVTLSSDFMQGMGPGDTELRLAKTDANVQEQLDADATSATDSLGIIPNGATGARTYDVPSGVDASAFDYAVVWCPTAAINFGEAALSE